MPPFPAFTAGTDVSLLVFSEQHWATSPTMILSLAGNLAEATRLPHPRRRHHLPRLLQQLEYTHLETVRRHCCPAAPSLSRYPTKPEARHLSSEGIRHFVPGSKTSRVVQPAAKLNNSRAAAVSILKANDVSRRYVTAPQLIPMTTYQTTSCIDIAAISSLPSFA